VRYFLRLGFLGFGGPVALVGQMERELVDERKWLTKEQMREAIFALNRADLYQSLAIHSNTMLYSSGDQPSQLELGCSVIFENNPVYCCARKK